MTANIPLSSDTSRTTTALMCAETAAWRCHRSLIADCLKTRGWTILHIPGMGQTKAHPYTSPAIIVGNQVVYTQPSGEKRQPSDPSQYRCRLPLRHPENTAKSCAGKEARSQEVQKMQEISDNFSNPA